MTRLWAAVNGHIVRLIDASEFAHCETDLCAVEERDSVTCDDDPELADIVLTNALDVSRSVVVLGGRDTVSAEKPRNSEGQSHVAKLKSAIALDLDCVRARENTGAATLLPIVINRPVELALLNENC
jgi:hypothetical protein